MEKKLLISAYDAKAAATIIRHCLNNEPLVGPDRFLADEIATKLENLERAKA